MQQEPRLLDLNGKQAVPYQIHAVFSLTFRVRQHNLCAKGQAGIADVCGKFIDFPDIIRGIGDKGSGQHEHHHEIHNGMDGFCGFPFDKPCVGNVNPHHQNENQQKPDIKSLRGQAACGNACKGLHIFPNGIRRRGNEVQRVGFLNQIPRGVGKVQADCPDKICDGIQPVHHLFSDTVQPVPREPVPSAVHIKIKLVVVQRIFAVFVGSVHRIIHQSGSVGGCAEDCQQQEDEQECQKHPANHFSCYFPRQALFF